ncbi:MAG: Dipeptide-binding protein DppE [Firmicutes bacterium]|nr:Dipeptide-binding protein DppE [candidate division NPL-UPA2 bacterium]
MWKPKGSRQRTDTAPEQPSRLGGVRRNHRLSVGRIKRGLVGIADVADNLIQLSQAIANVADNEREVVTRVEDEVTGYSALMQEILSNTENSLRLSQSAMSAAQLGQQAMESSAAAMRLIEQAVQDAKQATQLLRTKVKDIEHLLTVTRDHARTTRMLSLNASIEAARYDEGHGFMAVAEGIRELADRSVESVSRIKDSTAGITAAIHDAETALAHILSKVSSGTQGAIALGTVFNSVVASVGAVNAASKEILGAVADQTVRLEEIVTANHNLSRSFDKLSQIADVSSVYTEVTKSSLGGLTVIADDLARAAGTFHAAQSVPDSGRRLIFNLPQEPDTFDPHLNSLYYGAQVLANVHLGLLGTDSGDRLVPGLASKWHYDAEQQEWHFFLRQGARFSHGREVAAVDVKFSLERVADPKLSPPRAYVLSAVEGYGSFVAGQAEEISGIRVIAPHHLSAKMLTFSGDFLLNLAQHSCAIIAKEEALAGRIVGCGPYRIASRNKDGCVLEAFDQYCMGEPFVKEIEIRYGSNSLVERFRRRELDMVVYESVDLPKLLQGDDGVKLLTQSMLGLGFAGLRMTSDNPLVKHKEARRALAMAVDKHRLVQELFAALAEEAHCPVPPVLLTDPRLKPVPYDPARAKQVLSRLGIKHPQLLLLSRQDQAVPIFNRVEEFFAESLRQIGVEVEYVKVEHKVYLRAENLSRADAYVGRWVADSPSPEEMLTPLFDSASSMNRVLYKSAAVDEMLARARKLLNPTKREEIYRRVQRMVMDDMPLIPLYYLLAGAAYRDSELTNVNISPMGLVRCGDIMFR